MINDYPITIPLGIIFFVATCLALAWLIGHVRGLVKCREGALNDEGYFANGVYQYSCSECDNVLQTTERITDYFRFPVPSRQISLPDRWDLRYCWHCGVPFKQISLSPEYFSQHP